MGLQSDYPHWHLVPFRGMETGQFFESIDFMVYFTSSAWRESFGRVLAEGIAAGKVVISDEATASTFGGAVIAATPAEVGGVIAGLVERPDRYRRQVEKAQKKLGEFSAEAFGNFFRARVEEWQGCRT